MHASKSRTCSTSALRPQGHDLMLPACTGYLHKQSFIIRSLFEFLKFFFTLLLFRFVFRFLEFVRLSHSLLKYCVTVLHDVEMSRMSTPDTGDVSPTQATCRTLYPHYGDM